MKTVVAFGIFDILHPGHIAYLEAAKQLGGKLVVVVGRDRIARQVKGKAPVMGEQVRLRIVRALRCVDQAVLGDRPGTYRVLVKLNPDVLAIGYDQDAEHPVIQKLAARGGHPKIVRIKKFGKAPQSSSHIKHVVRSL